MKKDFGISIYQIQEAVLIIFYRPNGSSMPRFMEQFQIIAKRCVEDMN